MLKLSVLDQSISVVGKPEDQTVRDTIDLAQLCDTLGYSRFWLSEHHNHPTIMSGAPEVLMAAIAQTTQQIRIGSAGVMLPHYSPFKVAEQFRALDAIAPGRIDLGLGRAPGTDGRTGYAMNPNGMTNSESFPENVRDLIAWVSGEALIDDHPFGDLIAHPRGATSPEVWMLGTSSYGAQLAALLGMPYCFAYFITDGDGAEEAINLYRENYRPSERFPEPIATICVWALAAVTEEEATRLFAPRRHWKLTRDSGGMEPLHPPEVAAEFQYSPRETRFLDQLTDLAIYGTADRVAGQLNALAEKFAVDEIVVLTWTYDETDRRHSYELLASAFELGRNT